MRIFLDANILFSAGLEGSQASRLVERLIGRHEVITSAYAHEEVLRNIRIKQTHREAAYLGLARRIRILRSVHEHPDLQVEPKDQPILAGAMASGCDYLVTGDKRHFGHLYGKTLEGVTVVSITMMARVLEEDL
ncbi:MAG: putative toxin-antitoxin system toxin component, PIN family [Puniceicoccaceae bacterium]